MAFKLRQPIKIDPVARYEVPFTPDNIPDGSGLVARANDNGNMIVNKNIPRNSKLRKVAESHEDNHLRAMMDGKLAYDNKAVYHNMDGKGMKRTPRSQFDESDRNLAWEKPAYEAGEKMAKVDMKPKKNKLNRAGKVESGNFAFAFREIGKPMRSADTEKVSMNERFGSAMINMFGKGLTLKTGPGTPPVSNPDTDPSGNKTSQVKINQEAKQKAEKLLAEANFETEDLGDGKTRYYKEAEANVTKVVPGKKVTNKAGGNEEFLAGFKNKKDNALYEQYKGTEGGPKGEPGTREYASWKSTFAGFGDQTITGKAKVKDEYIKQDEEEETKEEENTEEEEKKKLKIGDPGTDCPEGMRWSKTNQKCVKKEKQTKFKKTNTKTKKQKLFSVCTSNSCPSFK